MTCLKQILRLLTAIAILAASEEAPVPYSRGNQAKLWSSCCIPLEGSGDQSDMYQSGVYSIKTGAFSMSDVWCDMDTAGGGWLTILRRSQTHKNITFERCRDEYVNGFGSLEKDFWLGLENMHLLTKNGDYELRVDLYDSDNETAPYAYVHYDVVKVNRCPDYTLELNGFTPSDKTLRDCLIQFSGKKFIVYESDEEQKDKEDCQYGRGGWWYRNRLECALQGSILTDGHEQLEWWIKNEGEERAVSRHFHKYEMKIRPKNCTL